MESSNVAAAIMDMIRFLLVILLTTCLISAIGTDAVKDRF